MAPKKGLAARSVKGFAREIRAFPFVPKSATTTAMKRSPLAPRVPPPGKPWDAPVHEAPLVFVDLEMTGLVLGMDRVIELCLERVEGGEVVGRVESLVKPPPGVKIPTTVHGLDAAALEGAPEFSALADDVTRILEGAVVVAHAAPWDVAFLEGELFFCDKPVRIPGWVDTLVLSRRAFAFERHSLEALCGEFGFERVRAHRAADDVAALRHIFSRCSEALAPNAVRDLMGLGPRTSKVVLELVGRAKESIAREAPVQVTYRVPGKGQQKMLMQVKAVTGDEAQGFAIEGYDTATRGRHVLRLERVVAVEAPPSV
jgi:DNA polymerase III subunit epsilon